MSLKVPIARGVVNFFRFYAIDENDKYGSRAAHVGHAEVGTFTNMSSGPYICRGSKIKS